MKLLSNNRQQDFQKINKNPYIVVFHESDIEGGEFNSFSFLDKKLFFIIAHELKTLMFELFNQFDEQYIWIGPYDAESNYCSWKDIKKYRIVKEIKKEIKSHNFKFIELNSSNILIEKIIEANLKYLTEISFFLPKNEIFIKVSHHSGFGVYSKNITSLYETLTNLINTKYNNWNCVLKDYYNGEIIKFLKD